MQMNWLGMLLSHGPISCSEHSEEEFAWKALLLRLNPAAMELLTSWNSVTATVPFLEVLFGVELTGSFGQLYIAPGTAHPSDFMPQT